MTEALRLLTTTDADGVSACAIRTEGRMHRS